MNTNPEKEEQGQWNAPSKSFVVFGKMQTVELVGGPLDGKTIQVSSLLKNLCTLHGERRVVYVRRDEKRFAYEG